MACSRVARSNECDFCFEDVWDCRCVCLVCGFLGAADELLCNRCIEIAYTHRYKFVKDVTAGELRIKRRILRERPPKVEYWGQAPKCSLKLEETPKWVIWAYTDYGYGSQIANQDSNCGRYSRRTYKANEKSREVSADFKRKIPWIRKPKTPKKGKAKGVGKKRVGVEISTTKPANIGIQAMEDNSLSISIKEEEKEMESEVVLEMEPETMLEIETGGPGSSGEAGSGGRPNGQNEEESDDEGKEDISTQEERIFQVLGAEQDHNNNTQQNRTVYLSDSSSVPSLEPDHEQDLELVEENHPDPGEERSSEQILELVEGNHPDPEHILELVEENNPDPGEGKSSETGSEKGKKFWTEEDVLEVLKKVEWLEGITPRYRQLYQQIRGNLNRRKILQERLGNLERLIADCQDLKSLKRAKRKVEQVGREVTMLDSYRTRWIRNLNHFVEKMKGKFERRKERADKRIAEGDESIPFYPETGGWWSTSSSEEYLAETPEPELRCNRWMWDKPDFVPTTPEETDSESVKSAEIKKVQERKLVQGSAINPALFVKTVERAYLRHEEAEESDETPPPSGILN